MVLFYIIMMNLVKYLSFCGAASRREAERLIRGGHVTVAGAVELNPARRIDGSEPVALDGQTLTPPGRRHYVLLHKPRGYVCSNSDRHARLLAVELIDIPGTKLVSAGRLDKDSEGAIIFSDDGGFINFLAHPRYEVLKRYHVSTAKALTETDLRRIRDGIQDDGEFLQVKAVHELTPAKYEFILNEGKKREIRRLVAACGNTVTRLVRMEIGGVNLGSLPCGKYRELTPQEVQLLYGENGDE